MIRVLARCFAGGYLALAVSGCAPEKPTVVAGKARFEFLTPSLVRLEYSQSGKFVDAPTAVVLKRDWPAVRVHTNRGDGWLTAASSAVTVRYRLGSGPFTGANLEVSWKDPNGAAHRWHPGEEDPQNLGGLTYSLDNISTPNLPQGQMDLGSPVNDVIPGIDVLLPQAKPGLLSRSGYAFIDDSPTPLWNAAGTWIEPRPQPQGQDWYLFTYGRDYARVLRDYAQLCGPIPMIPRYVLGPWVTDFNFEYFPGTEESGRPDFQRYNQDHLESAIARLRQNQIPLDVLVLDFAWHNYGWDGGYDWSPLFPRPHQLIRWLHGQGIKLGLNDHPGYANTEESIVSFSDSHAPQALQALGRPPPALPTFDQDISQHWEFAPDPHDAGVSQHWFAGTPNAGHWQAVRVGLSWEEQGYSGYRGIGWYRTTLQLPATLPGTLFLYLGEVAKDYRIFVNGHELTHSAAHWPQRLSVTDIAPYVTAGRQSEIVLRVEPGERGSGILRGPVALRDVAPAPRIYFDLSNQQQAEASMRELHKPLMQQGVDLWWVDGGSGAVDMPGLNKQLWTNKVFYDYAQRETGQRGFILGRYGDWGSERYPGYFTGDAYSEWPVLAYEVAFTARGGNVLVPYISHDIGGFHGAQIDFALYARWIEFGAFSPLLRMHSAHANPREDNTRMPWVYGDEGVALMKKYFSLRTQLIPYLYSYTWQAHRESIPLLRPLYLEYPLLDEAYQHPHEYFFGAEMLVAPVLDPGGTQTVYLPPGQWLEFFSGRLHAGGNSFTAQYAVDDTPVFVRAGAIIPEQDVSDYSNARPLNKLVLNVYGSGQGSFDLYEDDGISLGYRDGQYAQTRITHSTGGDGLQRLVIEPSRGTFPGQVAARAYELRVHGIDRPATLTVNGRQAGGWSWDAERATAVASVAEQPIRGKITVTWR